MFVSAEGRFVSMRIAEGRRPKGSGDAWRRSLPRSSNQIVERSIQTTFKPTRCRALSGGGTPLGKAAAVRGHAGRRRTCIYTRNISFALQVCKRVAAEA